ncbi:MAG: PhzF family phenazine biosynthesis protein [Candidatus Heimdallarchaeota archaeon]
MKESLPEGLKFYIVDVFAESKYEGNQLAVIIDDKSLKTELMQRIAKEMNFSETIFITSTEDFSFRIFTPDTELPFAGHPTLGAAFIFQKEFIKEKVKTILMNLKIGQIAALFKYQGSMLTEIWIEHKEPSFHGFFAPDLLAEILNIDEEDIDARFKIQEVSTGVPTIIIPLKSLEAIKKVNINKAKYYEMIENTQAKSILVFCSETYNQNNDLNVRFFADYLGVPEDPATGSANGCLAAYLVKSDYFNTKNINIRVEQGYEIGRKSLLLLRAEQKEGKFYIAVGGKVIMVAQGILV